MVYGRFSDNKFISAQDDLLNGEFSRQIENYKSYLKCTFFSDAGIVLNSGPFDHRTLIGNMTKDDTWALTCSVLNAQGNPSTDLTL
jgi:hypothetical protein